MLHTLVEEPLGYGFFRVRGGRRVLIPSLRMRRSDALMEVRLRLEICFSFWFDSGGDERFTVLNLRFFFFMTVQ